MADTEATAAEKDLEPTTATADPVSNPAPTPSKGDVH